MWLLVLLMAFAVYAQPQHVLQTGMVKKHLSELEDVLSAENEGTDLDNGHHYYSYRIPDNTMRSNEASEIGFTPDTTNEDYDRTQRLVREEERSMLVAGLHLQKKTVDTERTQNSSNSTMKVNEEHVLDDVKMHTSDNKNNIKEIGTSVGQDVTIFTYKAKAARFSSTESHTTNETVTQKTVVKSTGNGTKLQSKDKRPHSKPLSKTQVKNVPFKSDLNTDTKKIEEKTNNRQKEIFPYFIDNYCPPKCACYGRVVQCSDKGVDTVPYGIPYNSRYILLMNNRIKSIQLDLLREYSTMEFLALTNNRLTDGTIEGAFEGIPALKRLYLDSNQLRSIPSGLPTSLEELRLDNNQVGSMFEAAWTRCPGLLILSLSNNSLGNGSNSLPNAVLLPLCKLQTLNLDYNQLTSVPLGLPLSIKEMYLKGNRIEEFHIGAFNGVSELLVLDLSRNRLTNRGLLKDSLLNVTHLESFNLEGNRLKKIPQHLPPSLKTLNLEGNLITTIRKSSFGALINLEHLGLARNRIFKVVVGAFKALLVLHQLDLGHNALRQVPRQLPKSLHSVALSHNRIQTVPRDAFCWGNTSMSALVRVQLQNNAIDLGKIDTQSFRCLRGFQVVHFY